MTICIRHGWYENAGDAPRDCPSCQEYDCPSCAALRADLSAALARAEKAETGSYRVDAGIERFLERWDYVTEKKGPHDFITVDVLSDVVSTLRIQTRGGK